MRETEIARLVITWLTDQLWNVYEEVRTEGGGPIADIVAVRDEYVWVIETKTTLSLSLLNQAWQWHGFTHYLSVATPQGTMARRYSVAHDWLQMRGIGLITAHERDGTHERIAPRLNRWAWREARRLRAMLHDGYKDYAKAGSPSRCERWSPFRQTCKDVADYVSRHPGCTMKELVGHVATHYATPATARTALTKWIGQGIVRGVQIRREGRRIFLEPTEETS